MCKQMTMNKSESEVAQQGLTLCDLMDSSALGIFHARTLEWVATSSSREYSSKMNNFQRSAAQHCTFSQQ